MSKKKKESKLIYFDKGDGTKGVDMFAMVARQAKILRDCYPVGSVGWNVYNQTMESSTLSDKSS